MSGGSRLTEDAISLSELESVPVVVVVAGEDVLSVDSTESDCGFSRLEKPTDEDDGDM